MNKAKTVLMVAFHFPPIQGSSGVQRTLRFAQYLSEFGWRPIILTISEHAYQATTLAVGNEVPTNTKVYRAFGLDASRHLSLFGRYPRVLSMPDRWASWKVWAVRKGISIARLEGVDAIWSTYPIATAHCIGMRIAQRTRLPWIAEFRDPMWEYDYPLDPVANQAWRKIERDVFTKADKIVLTTPGAIDLYTQRFSWLNVAKVSLIENGYDEATFVRAEVARGITDHHQPAVSMINQSRFHSRPLVIVHSGIVYPSERDPSHFFAAIAALKQRGEVSCQSLNIILRASGNDAALTSQLDLLGIADIVLLAPPLGYLEALQEMLSSDGLLLMQASGCNAQIPAKLYEYLRAKRPVLALVDPRGDTAKALGKMQIGLIARLDVQKEIEAAVLCFMKQITSRTWQGADPMTVKSYSRRAQTGQLASILNSVV